MCAAGCFIKPDSCRLLRFDFERADKSSEFFSYIKPVVAAEMSLELSKLNATFPIIEPNTRFYRHYDLASTATPSQCFKLCKESDRCAGASFTTTELTWSINCGLFRADEFIDNTQMNETVPELEFWTSYRKEAFITTRETTTTTTTTTTTQGEFLIFLFFNC
jgi:hypothetical protein